MKTAINADEDLSASQKTEAAAEVDATIVPLVTQIKDFAAGL